MAGVVTIPVGLFVGGLIAGMPILKILGNLVPIVLIAGLIALGLWKREAAMSKVFERAMLPALEPHFLFYTFAFALVLCLALVVKNGERIGSRELLFGILVGVPNFFSARFMLRCLNSIPAVIAFPIYSVGGIVVASLAGVLFFRERLSRRRWTALAIIMCSIVLLNL